MQEGHLGLAKVLGKRIPPTYDEGCWLGNNAATFEVHEFQERCWESRKGFETFEFRDDLDLNISVVGRVQEFAPLCWTKMTSLHARAYRDVPNSQWL